MWLQDLLEEENKRIPEKEGSKSRGGDEKQWGAAGDGFGKQFLNKGAGGRGTVMGVGSSYEW